MSSKQRKPRPSMPQWFWYNHDADCITCKHPNGCSSCKHVKSQAGYDRNKQKKRPLE